MGKRLRKSEKLDLILSELLKLKGDIKKLLKDRGAVADQRVKAKPGSGSARRSGKVPKRTEAGKKKPVRDVALSKPQLVQAPQVSHPTSRPTSQ